MVSSKQLIQDLNCSLQMLVMIGNFDDLNTQTQAHLHDNTPIIKV